MIRSHDTTHPTQHDDAYEISFHCRSSMNVIRKFIQRLGLWSNELSWETICLRAALFATLCYLLLLAKKPINIHERSVVRLCGQWIHVGVIVYESSPRAIRCLCATHTHHIPYIRVDRFHNKPKAITHMGVIQVYELLIDVTHVRLSGC